MFSRHPSEPMVNKRGLSDAGPSNDDNHVDCWICPSRIEKRNVLLATKDLACGHGQSGHRDFFWPQSRGRLGGCIRGYLAQVLMIDCTSGIDRVGYKGHRLQKFSWILKTTRHVFVEKYR